MKKISGLILSCERQELLAWESLRSLIFTKPLWNSLSEVFLLVASKNNDSKVESFTISNKKVTVLRLLDIGIEETFIESLSYINNSFVYVMMDDRVIFNYNSKKLKQAINIFLNSSFTSLRLSNDGPMPLSLNLIDNLKQTYSYKTSLTNTIFKKNFLLSLLSTGKSIWEIDRSNFYINGMSMTASPSLYNYFFPLLKVHHLILKGKQIEYTNSGLFNKYMKDNVPLCANPIKRFYYKLYRLFSPFLIIKDELQRFFTNSL